MLATEGKCILGVTVTGLRAASDTCVCADSVVVAAEPNVELVAEPGAEPVVKRMPSGYFGSYEYFGACVVGASWSLQCRCLRCL